MNHDNIRYGFIITVNNFEIITEERSPHVH